MTAMLASVRSLEEARIALDAGADIVDLKEPDAGALGAVPAARAKEIIDGIRGKAVISATVGDLQGDPQAVVAAVEAMAGAGADIVKVGVFDDGERAALLAKLAPVAKAGRRLVAVLFADRDPVLDLRDMVAAGLYGVMIDTAGKERGSLPDLLAPEVLARFVSDSRNGDMYCGFAGSLSLDAIAPILGLNPDYLGFRGALCEGGKRRQALSAERVAAVRACIPLDPRAARLRHKTAFRATPTVGRY